MSGADRKTLRAEAVAALEGAVYFLDWEAVSAWQVFGLDASSLPAFGIATPDETRDPETQGFARMQCQLVLVMKRSGGDRIEDDLDDDADAAGAVVHAALRGISRACELTRTATKVDGSGVERAGSVEMTFTVTYWEDDPA